MCAGCHGNVTPREHKLIRDPGALSRAWGARPVGPPRLPPQAQPRFPVRAAFLFPWVPSPLRGELHTWRTAAPPSLSEGPAHPSPYCPLLLTSPPRLPRPAARAFTHHSQKAAPEKSLGAPHILCPLWVSGAPGGASEPCVRPRGAFKPWRSPQGGFSRVFYSPLSRITRPRPPTGVHMCFALLRWFLRASSNLLSYFC